MEPWRRLDGRILRCPFAAERGCRSPGRTRADMLNARAPENPPPSRKTAEPAFGRRRGLVAAWLSFLEWLLPACSAGRRCRRAAGVQRVSKAAAYRQPPALGRLCCPPIPPADGGRWHGHLRASGSSARARFGAGSRLAGTDAEGRRRAVMPSSVYCAPQTRRQPLEKPHLTQEGIAAPSRPA